MCAALTSPNDRLRAVAYSFFEHNPDRALVPEFLTALVSFNLGVEGGQLTVIALAYGAVGVWFGRKSWYRAYGLGSGASKPRNLL